MCWSPGVTLFFVVAEGLAAIVLAVVAFSQLEKF